MTDQSQTGINVLTNILQDYENQIKLLKEENARLKVRISHSQGDDFRVGDIEMIGSRSGSRKYTVTWMQGPEKHDTLIEWMSVESICKLCKMYDKEIPSHIQDILIEQKLFFFDKGRDVDFWIDEFERGGTHVYIIKWMKGPEKTYIGSQTMSVDEVRFLCKKYDKELPVSIQKSVTKKS